MSGLGGERTACERAASENLKKHGEDSCPTVLNMLPLLQYKINTITNRTAIMNYASKYSSFFEVYDAITTPCVKRLLKHLCTGGGGIQLLLDRFQGCLQFMHFADLIHSQRNILELLVLVRSGLLKRPIIHISKVVIVYLLA